MNKRAIILCLDSTCTEASIDYIAEVVFKLDQLILLPKFVALNLEKILDTKPEELNFIYILNRLNKITNIEKYLVVNDISMHLIYMIH